MTNETTCRFICIKENYKIISIETDKVSAKLALYLTGSINIG